MTEEQPTLTDEHIALCVCNGDKEMFSHLVDRYEDKITRYVRRFTQNTEDVTDLVQTIFIKAYMHLQSFDSTRSFNSWVYRIAHNESVNYLKKKGNSKVAFIDFDTFLPHPFAKETADKKTLDEELKKILDTSLEKLSPKYREVLILYYYDELSYQEIAEILRIPTSTVGVRIRRGKESLESILQTNHFTP